ncbi:MAG: ferritin [Candidatus Sumerlaeia bacterium]|nr:ferritin [Candidatus Sumerlaeia bacterium]
MIDKKLEDAINEQIVYELYSSNTYLSVASFMEEQGLKVLNAHFLKQSEEERDHAMKFIGYLQEVNGAVRIGAIPEPPQSFKSVEDAVAKSLKQEEEVTRRINNLMSMAHDQKDYATASFLKWFVDEQVEEQASMNDLLLMVRHAGPHLLLVEDRLLKQGVKLATPGEAGA